MTGTNKPSPWGGFNDEFGSLLLSFVATLGVLLAFARLLPSGAFPFRASAVSELHGRLGIFCWPLLLIRVSQWRRLPALLLTPLILGLLVVSGDRLISATTLGAFSIVLAWTAWQWGDEPKKRKLARTLGLIFLSLAFVVYGFNGDSRWLAAIPMVVVLVAISTRPHPPMANAALGEAVSLLVLVCGIALATLTMFVSEDVVIAYVFVGSYGAFWSGRGRGHRWYTVCWLIQSAFVFLFFVALVLMAHEVVSGRSFAHLLMHLAALAAGSVWLAESPRESPSALRGLALFGLGAFFAVYSPVLFVSLRSALSVDLPLAVLWRALSLAAIVLAVLGLALILRAPAASGGDERGGREDVFR